MSRASTSRPETKTIRCAIYTRKSTEEGLGQDFNTLDAQREAAEAFIASQKHEGWVCVPDHYDDGGFTGGNMDRPAVKRLIADIEAGKVNCVVVYKVDRLSRSLLDFSRMMSVFEKHGVSFVSVTQQFNTTHSMGRLTLNILLSFAQFEREIISERTRDKIAAARRKGKFVGGRPVLGYDVLHAPGGPKLVVNEDEAQRARTIFNLYLQHETLIATCKELARRGWMTKTWTARNGNVKTGRPFDKHQLFKMLTNVVYIGKVRYREELHAGEHEAIIDESLWQQVQARLKGNGRGGGMSIRNKSGALLKGLLRCAPCGCAMTYTYSSKGNKHYRYYVCLGAQKRGYDTCPSKSLPAAEIERVVVEQIKKVAHDPELILRTFRQVKSDTQEKLKALRDEDRQVQRDLKRLNAELRTIAGAGGNGHRTDRLAEVQDAIRTAEQRSSELRDQMESLSHRAVTEHEARAALTAFDLLWATLTPRERARVVHLLIERVDYNGADGTVAVTFRPNGLQALSRQLEGAAA